MNRNLVFISVLFLTTTLLQAQKAETFKWMEGTWSINAGKGTIVEKWTMVNDSTLKGKSFFIKEGKDTIPQETIELSFRNGGWSYIPTAIGQNNNQPVEFKIIFQKGTEFIAENPAHDFPQRIAYRRIKNGLFASIEGKRKDKYGKQNFDFTLLE
jgi:hypothetical protein